MRPLAAQQRYPENCANADGVYTQTGGRGFGDEAAIEFL